MDYKKIYKNVCEKIALDNFKAERARKRKNTKIALISLSAIAFISTFLVTINTLKKKDD